MKIIKISQKKQSIVPPEIKATEMWAAKRRPDLTDSDHALTKNLWILRFVKTNIKK